VQFDLEQLAGLDITPLDTPEPELAYLFKHIVTHEVTYESLPFATRAKLHEQLAKYLEGIAAGAVPLDVIAHHYGQSNNQAKQREYWQKAGDAAQEAFANDAALDYFAKLLPLLNDPNEQTELHLKRGDIMELSGQWAKAEVDYQAALTLAEQTQNMPARVRCQLAFSNLVYGQGDYPSAHQWAEQALAGADALADATLQMKSALALCNVGWALGNYTSGQLHGEQALALARAQGDLKTASLALKSLGVIAHDVNNLILAHSLYEESLSLARQVGNKPTLVTVLNNYGVFLRGQGELAAAQAVHTEQLTLEREMGDKFGIAFALANTSAIVEMRGLLGEAKSLKEQVLALFRALGAKRLVAEALSALSGNFIAEGDYPTAQRLLEDSSTLYRETGYKMGIGASSYTLGLLALITNDLPKVQAHFSESLQLWQELENLDVIADVNLFQGIMALMQGQATDDAQRLAAGALTKTRESGISIRIAGTLVWVGFIACHQQEYAKAQEHYLEALKLYLPTELRGFDWADAWAGLARAFMRQPATTARGVQLAAVAEKILKDMGAVLWPIVRVQFDDALAFAKGSLGEAAFQSAWEAGQRMTMEDAVELALKEL
jgi:tetratricopeptide (TPR) repeat protein